jgi:hypothetical protein
MTVEGVDYAFPPNPAPATLAAAGKVFACRYGGPGSDSKQLTAAELAGLTAAGIAVVANAEGTTDGLKGGYSAGKAWAADAEQHFRALGMPADRPIYLSVDFDANSTHWPALDAAMAGAASVLGPGRVGVYGGYKVIAHFASMKDKLATWYWQTYAWSGGLWHPAAHIQQYRNGVTIGGADCDLNRAMKADYGQWGVDMLTADDIEKISLAVWTRDLFDGVPVEKAYVMLKRAADAATVTAARVPADLAAQLGAILAAAQDDGDTTVVLPPDAIAALGEIKAAIEAVPTADENAEAVADELHDRTAE